MGEEQAEKKALTMMGFLFGDAAEAGQRNATPQALEWCEAFEEWLKELGRDYKASTLKQARLTWRRLVGERGKGAWELGREDIEGHLMWMEGEGYAAATRANMVGLVSSFYEWMRARGMAVNNPAEGVRRPLVGRYEGQALLSREEVGRLLRAMRRDKSALGKRDLAFTLARLKMGVPLDELRRLQWASIEHRGEANELPGEVQGAIWEALEAGGRLETMAAGDFVFAPLRTPGVAGTQEDWADAVGPYNNGVGRYRAEDWAGEKAVSLDALRRSLKLYGRLAGIAEGKLTWMALRRTGIRLRMDENISVDAMQEFLGSREERRSTKYRLGKLPGLPEDKPVEWEEGRTMERKARPFRRGEGVVHGMYMKSQPPEAVEEILAEKIEGLEEEVAGLRVLERGLVERAEAAERQEAVRLWVAYARAATRLGEVIRAEKRMAEEGKAGREYVEAVDRALARVEAMQKREQAQESADYEEKEVVYRRLGEEEAEWEEDEGEVAQESTANRGELEAGARRLVEEIAVSRYMLRNVFRRAMEAEETGEYIRLVDLYGAGCVRLVKMLKAEMVGGEEQVREIHEDIEEAIRLVNDELGIGREEE